MAPIISLNESGGVASGVILGVLLNLARKRPAYSGIYKHASFAVIGYFTGKSIDKMLEVKQRQRLQILEDYIRLHPEDFQEEAPKTYGDILLKWYPVR
ncbi:hypothetical protein C0Q70_06069 [Pomacea canaliculata]|uniref:NADH dehydrogenase [ubiquinone] 1 subunit C2 n=1 Tax=Pomacea canaliculata TaxID=400727 RepID=A0A2T7PN11_POMCA|nr:NADH dehydrogenase [ubiquinone] 1 subunit C2-like [Pomacea canaliculata]PVD34792.1 hypothetical protein C0Q70_06069 [Pomacea canaliculata]